MDSKSFATAVKTTAEINLVIGIGSAIARTNSAAEATAVAIAAMSTQAFQKANSTFEA